MPSPSRPRELRPGLQHAGAGASAPGPAGQGHRRLRPGHSAHAGCRQVGFELASSTSCAPTRIARKAISIRPSPTIPSRSAWRRAGTSPTTTVAPSISRRGDFARALDDISKVISFRPDSPRVASSYAIRAMLHHRIGDARQGPGRCGPVQSSSIPARRWPSMSAPGSTRRWAAARMRLPACAPRSPSTRGSRRRWRRWSRWASNGDGRPRRARVRACRLSCHRSQHLLGCARHPPRRRPCTANLSSTTASRCRPPRRRRPRRRAARCCCGSPIAACATPTSTCRTATSIWAAARSSTCAATGRCPSRWATRSPARWRRRAPMRRASPRASAMPPIPGSAAASAGCARAATSTCATRPACSASPSTAAMPRTCWCRTRAICSTWRASRRRSPAP